MGTEIAPREQCPGCQALGRDTDKDNLAVYADGKYCQAGCGYVQTNKEHKKIEGLVAGQIMELKHRGLSEDTCQKYNIRCAKYTGYLSKNVKVDNELVALFPTYKHGRVIRQKLKVVSDKKKQGLKGDNTQATALFGQQLFSPNKQIPIVVTEGEEDAAAIWQMTKALGKPLPAVSINNGANHAQKEIEANLEWLCGFKEVLFAFDMDGPGHDAFQACMSLFEPGQAKRVKMPLKDANEMLLAGRTDEMRACLWNAEIVKPNTIVFPHEIVEKVLQKPSYGISWPWKAMDKATYGMRRGEVYLLAAATSVGKTEFVREIITGLINNECKVGLFSFEQQPEQTMQRFIGALMNKRIYLPGCSGWDDEEISSHLNKLKDSIALYQPESGQISIESVLINIRFLAKAHKMAFFVIDNLKALATNPVIDGKRVAAHDYASHAMGQFVALAKQLNINIFVVNHLANDKISLQAYVSTSPKNHEEYMSRTAEDMQGYVNKPGLSWERGRTPGIENIWGSGAIKDLTDVIIVLSRDRVSKDSDIHRTTKVTFLKNRIDSNYEGFSFDLKYNYDTGRLTEDFGRDLDNRPDICNNADMEDKNLGVLS